MNFEVIINLSHTQYSLFFTRNIWRIVDHNWINVLFGTFLKYIESDGPNETVNFEKMKSTSVF